MRNMTARMEAREAGLKYYETNVPCKQGHVAPRAVLTGTCTECTKNASKKWLAIRPHKGAEYAAAYRARNPESSRIRDAVSLAIRRAENPEKYRHYRAEYYARRAFADEGRTVRPMNILPVADLVKRLQDVHCGGVQYVSGYAGMNQNANFLCFLHNDIVSAHPHNVLRGANPCPRCNHMKSSGEDAVAKFLSIFTIVDPRNRTLIKPRELDIYMPEHGLAVEYCGEYWHSFGDAKAEREGKNKHAQKYETCKTEGIRLLTIYESEWQERQNAIKRLLRNAVGKSRGKVMARKCELRKIENPEARAFYEKYHPQGGSGSGEHYGLYWKGKMVACIRFVLGANDRGIGAKTRVWTLGRYATRITVAGGASRLFKAFLNEHSPQEVKSFSDNRYFAGGMYSQLGFTLETDIAPDYQVWHPNIGIKPKSHYQRRVISKRLKELGSTESFDPKTDTRTEAEMTYLMGARRIYDCGKKRWIWNAKKSNKLLAHSQIT